MEVQEIKEQLKSIFRQVINNDKWITIHPNGEDGKGRPLLLKDGESPKEAIERTYGKGEKSDTKEERIEARRKHQEVVKKHNQAYKDFEDGKISMEELEKADKELEKSNKEFYGQSDKQSDSKDDELVNVTEDYYNRISEDELKKEFKDIQKEFAKWKDKKNFPEYKDYKNKLLKIKDIYEKRFGKQSDSKGDLDIKKTTVKMKSGKEKEIEYVDKVPEGYKKLEGAMTAPLGYTWYHNGKSIIDKDRRTILVKDKKQSDSKGDLDIKKTTVKMKSGKEREIEYVDKVPAGYKKLEGAMTAPLGYTWYHNGKSIIDKDRRTILVKDNKADNSKEQDMALIEELKKLITKVENTKGEEDMEIKNEKVDKRKLIDEVAGIMKSAGCDDEVIRTAIGKMEKMSYDDSEKSADNECEDKEDVKNCGKKVKNEDEEDKKEVGEIEEDVKEDVENRGKKNVKNSKTDYFAKLNEIYNSAANALEKCEYVSRADREKAAEDYFAR